MNNPINYFIETIEKYEKLLKPVFSKVLIELVRHDKEKGDSWKNNPDAFEIIEDRLFDLIKDLDINHINCKNELIDIIALSSLMINILEIKENEI